MRVELMNSIRNFEKSFASQPFFTHSCFILCFHIRSRFFLAPILQVAVSLCCHRGHSFILCCHIRWHFLVALSNEVFSRYSAMFSFIFLSRRSAMSSIKKRTHWQLYPNGINHLMNVSVWPKLIFFSNYGFFKLAVTSLECKKKLQWRH